MKNYRLIVSYDGTRYSGWERKADRDTIQGKLEAVITRMCGHEVNVIGAGRTDAGVHATAMTANVHMETGRPVKEIKKYINQYLPEDICVTEVKEVSERFHARYHAKGKTYIYSCYIGNNKPVFNRKYIYAPDFIPDVDIMKRAAEYMTGEHDFAGFCTNSSKKKSTVRIIDKIDIKITGSELQFEFHGNGFLYNMVRIMVGTLLKIGKGEMEPEEVNHIFETKKRSDAGPTAPALGLRLEHVDY